MIDAAARDDSQGAARRHAWREPGSCRRAAYIDVRIEVEALDAAQAAPGDRHPMRLVEIDADRSAVQLRRPIGGGKRGVPAGAELEVHLRVKIAGKVIEGERAHLREALGSVGGESKAGTRESGRAAL